LYVLRTIDLRTIAYTFHAARAIGGSENQRRDLSEISIMHYGAMFAAETADEIAIMTAAVIARYIVLVRNRRERTRGKR
jgi:hypothetical protein